MNHQRSRSTPLKSEEPHWLTLLEISVAMAAWALPRSVNRIAMMNIVVTVARRDLSQESMAQLNPPAPTVLEPKKKTSPKKIAATA